METERTSVDEFWIIVRFIGGVDLVYGDDPVRRICEGIGEFPPAFNGVTVRVKRGDDIGEGVLKGRWLVGFSDSV